MSLLSPSSPCWLRRYGHYFRGYDRVVSRGAWEGSHGSVGARRALSEGFCSAEALEPLLPGGSYLTITSLSFTAINVFCSTDFSHFLQCELHYEDLMAPVILLDFVFYAGEKTKRPSFKDTPQCFSYILFSFPNVSLYSFAGVMLADFHFIVITTRWGRKEKARRWRGVGLELHSKSLQGARLPSNVIYLEGRLSPWIWYFLYAFLLGKCRFFRSRSGPIFAHTSYPWKLGGGVFFFLPLICSWIQKPPTLRSTSQVLQIRVASSLPS